MSALTEVNQRFPNTDYARDAALKLDLTHDQLAGKEMAIGRWYLQQGYYNAAINRFNTVIENYQTTTHVPEALHRLTEAYLARSEEHTSELQALMRISYAVFCLKK